MTFDAYNGRLRITPKRTHFGRTITTATLGSKSLVRRLDLDAEYIERLNNGEDWRFDKESSSWVRGKQR